MTHKKSKKSSRLPRQRNKADLRNFYLVTNEPVIDKSDNLNPEIMLALDRIYHEIANNRPKPAIAELEALQVKHPDVPKIYNFLATAHSLLGNRDKVSELAETAYRKFPNYLFAKINYAQVLLNRGKFDAVPDLFDHKFDLKLLYPKRRVFHVSEHTGFVGVLCAYYCYVGRQDIAKKLYDNLLEIAPQSPMVAYARSFLKPGLRMRLILWLRRRNARSVDDTPSPPTSTYRFEA
ncbi:hypothetical protein Q9L42_005530 [Methylomarinum sp. Ch1-1]|uniref:Tetratricopeptide repeat protein n=1 Tax=Methylomarinum roseum TaxID=3067653 RepID=A0AAU7NXC6_9GAMM